MGYVEHSCTLEDSDTDLSLRYVRDVLVVNNNTLNLRGHHSTVYSDSFKGCLTSSFNFTEATCRNLHVRRTLPALGSAAAEDYGAAKLLV